MKIKFIAEILSVGIATTLHLYTAQAGCNADNMRYSTTEHKMVCRKKSKEEIAEDRKEKKKKDLAEKKAALKKMDEIYKERSK